MEILITTDMHTHQKLLQLSGADSTAGTDFITKLGHTTSKAKLNNLQRARILKIQIFSPSHYLRSGPVELPITHSSVFRSNLRRY